MKRTKRTKPVEHRPSWASCFNFASRYEIKNLITNSMKPLRSFIVCDQVFHFIPRCKVQKNRYIPYYLGLKIVNNKTIIMVCYNVIFNFKSLVYRQTDDDVILFTSKMTSTSSRLHSFMLSLLKSKTLTNIDQSPKSNGDENKQN